MLTTEKPRLLCKLIKSDHMEWTIPFLWIKLKLNLVQSSSRQKPDAGLHISHIKASFWRESRRYRALGFGLFFSYSEFSHSPLTARQSGQFFFLRLILSTGGVLNICQKILWAIIWKYKQINRIYNFIYIFSMPNRLS